MTGALSGTFFRFLLMCLGKWRPEPEAVPGETVRVLVGCHIGCGSLVGNVRLQRFLHRSASRNTVRKNVLFSRAGVGRFGLLSAIFGMRISTSDKAGGLVRPRPPALHRLAGGAVRTRRQVLVLATFSGKCESRACRAAVSFWVRNGGPFSEPFLGLHVGPPVVRKHLRRLNNGAIFLVQIWGHVLGKLLACGD